MQSKYFIIGLVAVLLACSPEKIDYTSLPDEKLKQIADSLAHAYIITDGHVDLPYRLKVKNIRMEKE
jgi:membrane dipeptidase